MNAKRSRDAMKVERNDRAVSIPHNAQYIPAASHLVLPAPFSRNAFKDSILSTQLPNGESITHTTEYTPKPFIVTRPSFCRVLGSNPTVRCLARSEEGRAFAHEAGVWVGASNEVWFTSNLMQRGVRPDGMPNMTVEISAVNVDNGKVRVIDLPQIAAGNGACPFGGDRIIFCDQGAGADRPSQLTLVDPRDPLARPEDVLINNFHGRHFNSLNDVIVLPSPRRDRFCRVQDPEDELVDPGSTIWFTDPPYGYEQSFRPEKQLPPQVYVLNPSTGDVRVVADGMKHPNGICFSPDGSTCYITDTSHIHGTGKLDASLESTVYAFDVVWSDLDDEEAGPSLQNKRVFAFADTGVPDGIKCDHLGNVYAGCGDGLHVWNKHGTLIGKIVLGLADNNPGAGCANFCFVPGGRIICFAEDRIYIVEGLQVEGDLIAQAAPPRLF